MARLFSTIFGRKSVPHARNRRSEPALQLESLEVREFGWDGLPWGELAFPSVAWALEDERAAAAGAVPPFANPPAGTGL